MLYKKYHRNYARQFKKGAKFMYQGESVFEVVIEPHTSFYNSVDVNVAKNGFRDLPVRLIYSSGRPSMKNIKFIENVV